MHISQQHLVILSITRLIMIYFTVYQYNQYILQYKTLEKIFDQKQKNLATLDKNRKLWFIHLNKFILGGETGH